MLRISKLTDYGTLLMAHLAVAPEAVFSAAQLAGAVHLGRPTVSKLLKALVRAGLLVSQRGAQGGYRLSQAPQDITLAHIIAALEAPVALTQCSEGDGRCCLESSCTLRDPWRAINGSLSQVLGEVTLADLVRRLSPPRTGPVGTVTLFPHH
jgi:FeS assembly SUF system regulator